MSIDLARPVAILISPVLPEPTGSGRALRAWAWVTELAREHEVHVVVADVTAAADEGPSALAGATAMWRCRTGFEVPRRLVKGAGLALAPLSLLSRSFVLGWHYLTRSAFAPKLVSTLKSRQVSRIIVFRHYLADLGESLVAQFPGARLELDMDDLESQTRVSLARAYLDLGKYGDAAAMLASAVQYKLLETRLPGSFAQILIAAEEDRLALARRGVRKVACRPNRVPSPRPAPDLPPSGDLRLLFVGTLNYAPNLQAVHRLLRSVVPELRRQVDGKWRLTIAGRQAPLRLVEELRSVPEIDFVDDAPDLAPLYRQAQIALVPLRAGGGTKLKTIEAFAHGRAVVSTRHGVRGLAAVPDRDFLLAESDRDFATAITALAHDRARLARVAQAGMELCRDNYAAY